MVASGHEVLGSIVDKKIWRGMISLIALKRRRLKPQRPCGRPRRFATGSTSWALALANMAAQLQCLFEGEIARRAITSRLRHPQQNDVAARVGPVAHSIAWRIRAGGCRPWLDPWGCSGFYYNARRYFCIEITFHSRLAVMADATTIGRLPLARRARLLSLVRLMGAKSTPQGAWTGPPSRAREDVVEKYPGVKKGC
jgi:hypothetical protein